MVEARVDSLLAQYAIYTTSLRAGDVDFFLFTDCRPTKEEGLSAPSMVLPAGCGKIKNDKKSQACRHAGTQEYADAILGLSNMGII